MIQRLIIPAATVGVIFIGALVLFYTPERQWSSGKLIGDEVQFAPLEVALPRCLNENDPLGFKEFTTTGVYRISGWFLPDRPERAKVNMCMRFKGWFSIPTFPYYL